MRARILTILFLFCIKLNAQNTFNSLLGGCDDDYGHDMVVLVDNTKYILSSTKSFSNDGSEHILISKINSENNQIWSKILYGERYDIGYSIKIFNQKIIVSGTTRRTLNGYRVFAMQIDTSGQIEWSNTYMNGLAYDMNISSDNEILLTGVQYENNGYDKMFILKIDSMGKVSWHKEFYSLYTSEGQAIIQTTDNKILVSGNLGYGGDGVGFDSKRPVLLKLDNSGNIIWMKYYLFNNTYSNLTRTHHKGNVLESSVDGNYFITGTLRDTGHWKSFLLKINSLDGSVLWNKTYDFGGNDYINGMIEKSGNIYLFGNETYSDTNLLGQTNVSYDMVIINTNINGEINWARTYGCLNPDYLTKLSFYNNNLYIIGSSENSYGPDVSYTKSDSYYSELDTNGNGPNLLNSNASVVLDSLNLVDNYSNFSSNTLAVSNQPVQFFVKTVNAMLDPSACEPVSIKNNFVSNKINVFPNPNNGLFTVDLIDDHMDLTLCNIYGQVIYENKCSDRSMIINILKFQNGLYLLRIKKNNYLYTTKIIKL